MTAGAAQTGSVRVHGRFGMVRERVDAVRDG